jgi:ABC-type transport system involved in Fe-S cluster assembly fused permease/ATPase subunit
MLITKNQSKLHNTPEEQILQHAHIDNQDQKNTLIMHHTLSGIPDFESSEILEHRNTKY